MQSQKWHKDLCSFLRQIIQYTVFQVYALSSNAEEAEVEWLVLWRPTRPTRTNTKKRCSFHYRGLKYKNRKSRDTWSNRQIWPWSTEWNRAKQTPSSNNTREDSTHGHHQMVNTEIRLIIFFAAKDGKALYSQQKQYRELTVAQIINFLLPNWDWNWRK